MISFTTIASRAAIVKIGIVSGLVRKLALRLVVIYGEI